MRNPALTVSEKHEAFSVFALHVTQTLTDAANTFLNTSFVDFTLHVAYSFRIPAFAILTLHVTRILQNQVFAIFTLHMRHTLRSGLHLFYFFIACD